MSEKVDIVIGAVHGYGWENVAVWARSLVKSGFRGVGVVIVYGGGERTEGAVQYLRSLDIRVVRMPLRGSVYNLRFEDISYVLRELLSDLRYAIVTDVRDVCFQSDPTIWLEANLEKRFVASSEGIRYADEEWNRTNLAESFPRHVDRLSPKTVYNVGVLAGEADMVADICLAISLVAKSSAADPADQSAYNLLLDMEPYRSAVQLAASEDGFACQSKTIGSQVLRPILQEPQPVFDAEGVKTASGRLYPIVHQYDTIPDWHTALWDRACAVPVRRDTTSRLEEVLPEIDPAPGAGPAPRVTIACPTYGRPQFLRQLVEHYCAQTFDGGLEMVILDDSPERADFLDDPKYSELGIRYHHIPAERLTLGAKLNLLTQLARGEIIIEFDDDDYYAPQYVERMVELLGDADFITLSGWFCYDPGQHAFGYWSTDVISKTHYVLSPGEPIEPIPTPGWDREFVNGFLWGYGFSFVWRKSVFPDVEILDDPVNGKCCDLDFALRLQEAGFKTLAVPDDEGLVLHIVHRGSSVRIFPQYLMPEFMIPKFFPSYPGTPE